MLEVTAKDWHINQTIIPMEDSEEYETYYAHHEKLCKEGCTVGGIYIPGYLYWHLNFWNTPVDYLDERGRVQQKYSNPLLRDNEWIIWSAIQRAEEERKGLCIFGSRRIAKSTQEASYIGHGATFDAHSQNVIAGINSGDIKIITDQLDKGLNHLPKIWRWMRIEDDWKKQVTLGVKEANGTRHPFSSVIMRNFDNGDNQEAIAGLKPRKLIIDEAAKERFLKGLKAATPGFTTMYGLSCSPIVVGTGGDFRKFADAKELFFNPESFNFLEFPHEEKEKVVHGLFLGAKYRQEGKVESTLADYLGQPENKDLKEFKMLVSDEEKALKITKEGIEKARLSGDKEVYLKEKMYFPIKVEDIFVSNSTNIFNGEAIKKQIQLIEDKDLKGTPVELYHDGEKIRWKHSDKQVITEYPIPKGQSKDAPIVIWEHPIPNAPWGLYTAGVDDYRFSGDAKYSDSLGSVYIYKRVHNISGEGFQEMFVAVYTARPEDKENWNEQARLLIKYYNAIALCENDELSFINYMINKGDAIKYLAPQPNWLKAIAPFTSQKRDFGVSRSAERIRNHLHSQYKKYMDEVVHKETDEEGSVISETLGVNKIFDVALLKETLVFDNNINVDRIVAAELALAMANDLDPLVGRLNHSEEDTRYKSYFNKDKGKNKIFSPVKGIFRKKK